MSEPTVSKEDVMTRLRTVIDPELHVDIVSMGLIYEVSPSVVQSPDGAQTNIHILMTLTTPGCPLAGVFDRMVKDALHGLPGIVPERDVRVELTFDPPWVLDMMDPEVRAELGFA